MVPQIYAGNLKGLTQGLRDTEAVSRRLPGVHIFDVVHGKDRSTFRMYENGECTFQAEPE